MPTMQRPCGNRTTHMPHDYYYEGTAYRCEGLWNPQVPRF